MRAKAMTRGTVIAQTARLKAYAAHMKKTMCDRGRDATLCIGFAFRKDRSLLDFLR